jgi:prophage regulatory protein
MTTTQAESVRAVGQRSRPSGNRILRLPSVMELTGLGRSSIYARMSEKSFPASISLGARAVGWLESSIVEWIDGRVAASRKETVQ